jgi:hypothetical protein
MKLAVILAFFALAAATAAVPLAPARIKAPGVDGVTGEYSDQDRDGPCECV